MPADLHPDLEALTPLLGTWSGRGEGHYPTIQPFEYLEEVVFSHVGKPFLAYAQISRLGVQRLPVGHRDASSWFWLTRVASPKSKSAPTR